MKMVIIKSKKEKEKAKGKIVPNTKLYGVMLFISVVLTVLSLLVKTCTPIFTIWTSISCGGIASIIVAWLIDSANCRQETRRLQENRKTIFRNFYHAFDTGIQVLAFECAKESHSTDAKTWFEWIEDVGKQSRNNQKRTNQILREILVFIDEISEQIYLIKVQETTLLDIGIICQEDIHALSTMKNICELSQSEFQSRYNDQECLQYLITNCKLLKGIIGSAPSLCAINDVKVEPKLYKYYMNE